MISIYPRFSLFFNSFAGIYVEGMRTASSEVEELARFPDTEEGEERAKQLIEDYKTGRKTPDWKSK